MRFIILVLSVLFIASNIHAQRIQHLKKGNSFYKQKDYVNAVGEYEKLWNSTAGAKLLGVDAKMNLANCYRIMDNPFKANELYSEVMDYAEDRLSIYLEYGKVLMALGRYDDAIRQFELYSQNDEESTEPAKLIQQCKDIDNIEPLFAKVDIVAQDAVNEGETRQIGITYYGDAVVFASDEMGDETGDMREVGYLNMRASGVDATGNLKKSDRFSHSLNGFTRHDGPAAFTRDGIQIFYSQSVKTRDGKSVLQIWSAFFKNQHWSEPTPMPFMIVGKNFTHPTLSPDGHTLYFASDMKGTHGGLDIWSSHYENGQWTYPKNLGTDINTEQDDAWPFLHPDGDLYFSSKGHPGFGGYDIFRTRPLGNGVDWLPIENLGQPFNSSFSDVSFIMSDDQTTGFLSSNRLKSYDIFGYKLPNAEPQSLPSDIPARKSTGLSEISHDVILDAPFPEQTDDMTDVEYMEHLQNLAEEGKLNLPKGEEEVVPNPTTNDQGTTTAGTNPEDALNKTMGTEHTTVVNPTLNTIEDKDEIILQVVLKVMDVDNSRPLSDATVIVKNKFTQKETSLSVNERGEVTVRLDKDQKYELIGECAGYAPSSLPVSTMGVTESDRVQANMPMQKA